MPGRSRDASDCRCHCGALLARVVAGGVELKCRHCKRVQFVPFEGGRNEATSVRERGTSRAESLGELRG